ncbi:MAG: hypothetical protein GXY06_08150 [Clostridiaceae bacterium]|nr:hypothetical protein [Clostridiaceae bacterium]
MSISQCILFAEPNYSETGVWCELSPGIDPTEWAYLCRHIGSMTPKQFRKAQKKVYGNPDSIVSRQGYRMKFLPCVFNAENDVFGFTENRNFNPGIGFYSNNEDLCFFMR